MNYILNKTIASEASTTSLGIFQRNGKTESKNSMYTKENIIVKLYINPDFAPSLFIGSRDRWFGLKYESEVYDYLKRNDIFIKHNFFIKGESMEKEKLNSILFDKEIFKEFVKIFNEIKENDKDDKLSSIQYIISKQFNEIVEKNPNKTNEVISATVMEYIPGLISFHELLLSGVLDKKEDDLRCILYQIVHSLVILKDIELQHNDFHSNNILIVSYNEPRDIICTFGTKSVILKTKYKVLIFDWDMAWSPHLGKNKKLDYLCNNYGICGKEVFNEHFDLYTILCTIKPYIKSEQLKNIIRKEFGITKENISKTLYACRFQQKLLDDFKNVYTPDKFINHPYFTKINSETFIDIPYFTQINSEPENPPVFHVGEYNSKLKSCNIL